jgi:hypothetical protein
MKKKPVKTRRKDRLVRKVDTTNFILRYVIMKKM